MALLDSVCGFEQTIHSVLRFSLVFEARCLPRRGSPAQAFYPTSILQRASVVEREWREASDMRPSVFTLALIITVAALLRFVAHRLRHPFQLGVDEPEIMARVVQMMRTGDFNPHFFDYPGLYFYLQLGVAVLRFLVGATLGQWTSLDQVDTGGLLPLGTRRHGASSARSRSCWSTASGCDGARGTRRSPRA